MEQQIKQLIDVLRGQENDALAALKSAKKKEERAHYSGKAQAYSGAIFALEAIFRQATGR